MTRDYNKGISSITYNKFGSPQKVTFANRNSVEYVYSADGIKLKVRHITAVPQDGTGSSSSSKEPNGSERVAMARRTAHFP